MNNIYTRLKSISKKKATLFALCLLQLLVFHVWVFNNGYFTFGDTGVYTSATQKEFFSNVFFIYSSTTDIGTVNLTASNAPVLFLFGLLAKLHINPIWSMKFIILLPAVFLAAASSYLLVFRYTKKSISAFAGALVYTYNTYFLISLTQQLYIAVAYALSPFVILKAVDINNDKEFSLKNSICFAFILAILGFFEFRILYINVWIIMFYLIYDLIFKIKNKGIIAEIYITVKKFFIPFLILLMMNVYWLLPISKLHVLTENNLFNRGLFGDIYYDLLNALTLFHPWWTFGAPLIFEKQNAPLFYFIIPIFVCSIFLFRDNKNKKIILFYALIFLLGVLLTKQSAKPFDQLYINLYKLIPGFNAFREASKFYIFTALSLSIIVGFFMNNIQEIRSKSARISLFVVVVIFMLIFVANMVIIFNGNLKTMFVSHTFPKEYELINSYILNQNSFFRTYWLPYRGRFATFTKNHPAMSTLGIIDQGSSFFDNSLTGQEKFSQYLYSPFNLKVFGLFLDASSVKYIMLPSNLVWDDAPSPWKEPMQYLEKMKTVKYIKDVTPINLKDSGISIFENEGYVSYFHSITSLFQYDSFKNIDKKYIFSSSMPMKDFDFTVRNENDFKNVLTRNVHLLFEDLDAKQMNNDGIDENVKIFGMNNGLYSDIGKINIVYVVENNELSFSANFENNLVQDSKRIENFFPIRKLATIPLDVTKQYFASVGSRLISFDSSGQKKSLDVLTKPFEIFASDFSVNLIPDGSFAQGTWQDQVGDCNAYDGQGVLGMTVAQEGSEGGKALELNATSHVACTGPGSQSVDGGKKYLLSFDYQSPNGQVAGYYIAFNDSEKHVISEKLPVEKDQWHHFQKSIDAPEGATTFSLVVYSYSIDNKTPVITRYSNFKMSPLEKVTTIDPQYQQNFQKVDLPQQASYDFSYQDSAHDFSNLIRKSSFEDGLWNDVVGDCNNYNDKGKLGVALSDVASDGSKSLELQATRHIACTGPGVLPAVEDKTYFFSFDYQSPNGKEAGYYLGFNDPDKTVISERLPIGDKGWHTFTKQIKVPAGASSVSLAVYSYATDDETNIITRYDNFHFVQLPDLENRYYLVSDPKTNFVNPAAIDFDLLNPTKKLVHIKGATTPFYLAMSEAYHPQWQAQLTNNKIQGFFNKWIPWVKPDRISDDKHFELDGFLNGWFVEPEQLCANNNSACKKNPDGSYDIEMTVEFFPQRWFYLGLLISGTTLLSCLGYLGYDLARRRKNKSNLISPQPPHHPTPPYNSHSLVSSHSSQSHHPTPPRHRIL